MRPALLLGLMLLIAGCASTPVRDDNLIGLETPNGRLARDFIDLWFNQHQPELAFDRYVSRDHYMNHAVYSGSLSVRRSFEEEKQQEARVMPAAGTRFEFRQIIAQGSLVLLHIQVLHPAPDPGRELLILLRIREGKVTDHWDLHEALRADSTVFAGLDR